jgi:hypothetical protein
MHLDESVSNRVAVGLRRRGIDVTTSVDVGLLSASDEEHIRFAFAVGRVVFTHDRDFLALHDSGFEHAGIVYCHQHAYSLGELVHGLDIIANCLTDDEIRGKVQYL